MDRQNIKLSFSKPYYKTNKNGTTICILHVKPLFPNSLRKYLYLQDKKFYGFTVVGKAILQKDDDFDKHIGEKLSLAKAENKAYIKLDKMLKQSMKEFHTNCDHILTYSWLTDLVVQHNEEYITGKRNELYD